MGVRSQERPVSALSLWWVKSYIAAVNWSRSCGRCHETADLMSLRMKLPFFKSRKRKAKEEAELAAKAAEQETAEPAAEAEAPPAKAERQTGKGKTRRVPAEQVVDAIGYALAAVP